MSEQTPFYSNTEDGKTVPVNLTTFHGIQTVKKSLLVGRKAEPTDFFISSTSGFGFPGIPFVPGEANPANFCQGEDVIFDAFLYYQGEAVTQNDYDILVQVKSSLRSPTAFWVGEIQNGVYPEENPGYYTIWLPAEKTMTLFAGSYNLNVFLSQQVGKGSGPHDRKISLIDIAFNIEYCGGSENPENVRLTGDLPHRASIKRTWPNAPDIIQG
jgi:hypothetical protein